MSSFKRKSSVKQSKLPSGTRSSPSSSATTITSSGIPSLDDILGGGLPLTCSLLVLAPDSHSAYGELVQKYFIAQGIASEQQVCVIADNALDTIKDCMWTIGTSQGHPPSIQDDEKDSRAEGNIKIAWRYEQMKEFQTTVSSVTSTSDDYCRTFDLTCRIPESAVARGLQTNSLICVDIPSDDVDRPSTTVVIQNIMNVLKAAGDNILSRPIRICIPSFGSPGWGDLSAEQILFFMHSVRGLLRKHPNACACVSLAPHISSDRWGGPGWTDKLAWASDAAISLAAFTADPTLSSLFSTHHGLLQIHSLPAPHTLVPPSDKFSTLRGLSSSGENNLAFKCTRRRLVFETLHLDLEGGVGERRTTPSANAIALDAATHTHETGRDRDGGQRKAAATLEVALELDSEPQLSSEGIASENAVKRKKSQKRVAFRSDKPDLYDF